MLSKSSVIRGLQCVKSLYLNYYYPYLRDKISDEQKARFSAGIEIGKLAQTLFPAGIEIPFNGRNKAKAIEITKQTLLPDSTLFEACFEYNDVFIACDILQMHQDKSITLYEVKSSTRLSPVYIQDAAIQHYVLKRLGYDIRDVKVMYINNKYRRKGALQTDRLFKTTSVLKEVRELEDAIAKSVSRFKEIIKKHELPQVNIGTHCFSPYPCDFQNQCWKDVPENSIFELKGVNKEQLFEWYHQGVVRLTDIDDLNKLPLLARLQVKSVQSALEKPDITSIQAFLRKITYPVSFLDFETFQSAVPLFENAKPYEQTPFQYSLHILQKNNDLQHVSFIADWNNDIKQTFLESLLKSLPENGSIVTYNAAFEKMILNQLATDLPEYSNQIQQITSRIIDLMQPFKKGWYYLPAMQGSASLKYVLPAIFPELSYQNLNISDGLEASSAFLSLQTETDMFKIQEIKQDLETYCKQDTFALVKIYEHLKQLVENKK